MEALMITATRSTPAIRFDPKEGLFCVIGNSYPENASEFYAPVLAWCAAHAKDLPAASVFSFRLSYFSTSSMKAIYVLLKRLNDAKPSPETLRIVWQVEEQDEFMLDAFESFNTLLGAPMELVEITRAQAAEEDAKLLRGLTAA